MFKSVENKHIYRVIAVFVLLLSGTACQKQHGGNGDGIDISRKQLKQWRDQKLNVHILDVRSKKEFESGHIPNAMNIDYTEISSRLDELNPYKNHKIVLYCRTGRRAGIAIKTLKKAGFSELYHLTGDIIGWREAGLPIESGTD